MKLGIVTTFIARPHMVEWFIKYHRSIGFTHFYFFADFPDFKESEYYQEKGVRYFRRDKLLLERWQNSVEYWHLKKFAFTELIARQELNINVTIDEALNDGVEWLLHIDIDELFSPPDRDATKHFSKLNQDEINVVSYPNLEAIPELSYVYNYFEEIHLFKRNISLLNDEARQMLFGTKEFATGKNYFHFYQNGKSAGRVSENLNSFGVHDFRLIQHDECPGEKRLSSTDTFILHYACCGFNNFLEKYRILGDFPDTWTDEERMIDRIPMHVRCRDICRTENIFDIKNFYCENFSNVYLKYKNEFLANDIYVSIRAQII